jgi:hypothetical protein
MLPIFICKGQNWTLIFFCLNLDTSGKMTQDRDANRIGKSNPTRNEKYITFGKWVITNLLMPRENVATNVKWEVIVLLAWGKTIITIGD